jgi:hypothetical protein
MGVGEDDRARQDQRRSARGPAGIGSRVTLRVSGGSVVTAACRLVDVSETGVGFVHWAELPAGERVVLHRPARGDALVCVVRTSRPRAAGGFHVGVAIVGLLKHPVADADVREALDAAGEGEWAKLVG